MDAPPLEQWIGRERITEDSITLERARKLSATLDLDPSDLYEGGLLPHGWHWIYFHELVPRSALAEDGHEQRGAFLPPIPLDRRMWAGGALSFFGPLRIGTPVRRVSTIRSIEQKQGRSGPLAFVTVEHRLHEGQRLVLEERQDLVYLDRRPVVPGARSAPPQSRGVDVRPDPEWTEPFVADEVTLFRFSALTFNGHRIHFDRHYASEVEGYPDVVVHGPLLALLLLGAGVRRAGLEPRAFTYRALQPIYCNEAFALCGLAGDGSADREGITLWAEHPDRGVAMRAELAVEP